MFTIHSAAFQNYQFLQYYKEYLSKYYNSGISTLFKILLWFLLILCLNRVVIEKIVELLTVTLEELLQGTLTISWSSLQKKYELGVEFNFRLFCFHFNENIEIPKNSSLNLVLSIDHISKPLSYLIYVNIPLKIGF